MSHFQRLELVLGFPEALGGTNAIEYSGFVKTSTELNPDSKISDVVQKCIRITQLAHLPIQEFFFESSTATILLSLGRKGLIGNEIKTCRSSGIGLFDGENLQRSDSE